MVTTRGISKYPTIILTSFMGAKNVTQSLDKKTVSGLCRQNKKNAASVNVLFTFSFWVATPRAAQAINARTPTIKLVLWA